MRLTYLKIQHFGKLKEKEIFLKDGINVIYGPNESGKSTLHAFIRGMLFGMIRYRGRASKTDPYTRYEPWERPADYAGTMRFAAGGKSFCLERNFYKGDVRERLVCETDGEQLSVAHGDLQMLLGGISESVYDNTVSIGQLRSETDEGMMRELQNHMSNYENAGSGDIDVQRAAERLRKKKKEWETKVRELELKQIRQEEQLENRIMYVRQEQAGLEAQLKKVRMERTEWENRPEQTKEEWEDEKKPEPEKRMEDGPKQEEGGRVPDNGRPRILPWIGGMIPGCLLILMALWNLFSAGNGIRILLGVSGAALAVLCGWRAKNARQKLLQKEDPLEKQQEDSENPPEEKKTERIDRQAYISRLQGREDTLLQQIEEKATVAENLLENREELREKPQEIINCETEIQSLELALKKLGELSGGMRKRIGQRLQGRMEEILSEITEGRYGRISMDQDMKISLYEWNRQVALGQLSRGTVEQVYFALRMAVSEVLCEEPMPVLLDDVFAMYDEKRLMQTLRWLSRRGGQVIIFTCHRREEELLRHLGIKGNFINLEEISC